MKLKSVVLAVLAAFAVSAQDPAPAAPATHKLEFEVASVKPSAPFNPAQGGGALAGFKIDGAQVRGSIGLSEYVLRAFRIKDLHQLSAPTWLNQARFDINAKLPDGATRDQVPEMLQALLEDRFKMKTHRETKDLQVYALVVAKGGPKLTEAAIDPDDKTPYNSKEMLDVQASGGPQGITGDFGKGMIFSMSFTGQKMEFKKFPMSELATVLSRFLERPVIDMTELKGRYDFDVKFTPEDFRGILIRTALNNGAALPPEALKMLEGTSETALFSAVQTLGLKLEPRKAPLEVLVIDSIEKTPTEN